ncbi:putative quinol monooxygenase [Uliginosibacterium sp. TH139]|uniref:putative quinol monooxygenase n=1 Tax=Uliginosibacterium sp. TH139 TaxID=2067453 RepID=UPI001304349E|nr:putative quinol monooxygenase [Uliginosibacterium sp. TH139]
MSIYVFASVTPKAEHLEAAEIILRAAVSESRKEAGCLRYDLFKTVQGETSFQFLEAYTDQAALIAHAQSAHFLTLKEQITPLLAQPLTISITSAVDVAA